MSQALDLNDKLQILLEKHDAMVSGSPVPAEVADVVSELPAGTTPNLGEKVAPTTAVASTNVLDDEEEDEDDEFSQLARRSHYCHHANLRVFAVNLFSLHHLELTVSFRQELKIQIHKQQQRLF